MGNFYGTISIRGANAEAVAESIRALNRNAFVTEQPVGVVVADELSDDQTDQLGALAEHLSQHGLAVAVWVADDDYLWMQAYLRGDLIAEYANMESPPTDVAALAKAAEISAVAAVKLRVLLLRPFVFQADRHSDLLEALGMPRLGYALGYRYMSRGEREEEAHRVIEVKRA